MELKYVVPNMEKTFGNLEFAGESKIEQQRVNGRYVPVTRSYNLYSDVQRADDIIVTIPAKAGEKHFKPEQKIKLINNECRRIIYGNGVDGSSFGTLNMRFLDLVYICLLYTSRCV